MPDFKHGLQRGASTIVTAFIVSLLTKSVVLELVEADVLPKGLFSGIIVLSIVSVVMTIDKSRYWSFRYLAGFPIGIFLTLPLLDQTTFIGHTDWILYSVAAIGAIALRVKIHS